MLSSYQGAIMTTIKISNVCGLCAGCKTAISTAKHLSTTNKTVLFKEIVHNKTANQMLSNLGIKTIDNLKFASRDEVIVLRAHGEPPETYNHLNSHHIPFVDCTCPNVTKIHEQVCKFSKDGYKIIILGKYGKTNGKIHPEVFGTIGWCASDPILIEDEEDLFKLNNYQNKKLYLVCQTTFNAQKADKLIEKISHLSTNNNCALVVNKSICNAQKAINLASVKLAQSSDIMIIVGGKNSSNSIELFNNIKTYTPSIFIEDIHDWKNELINQNIPFSNDTKFGITAGASTLKEELLELKKLIELELSKKV